MFKVKSKMEKSRHHIQRLLKKIAEKFPVVEEPEVFTDIHLRVSQDSGDVMAYDDDDKELTRVVVDEWIDSPLDAEEFYNNAFAVIQGAISDSGIELGILKPYNYILENENGEHIAEVYVVDDEDTLILSQPFMQDLDSELDSFIDNLLKD